MALRVLLADESSTIKKVFQLALQDYAVEVRSVNVGVDVLPVAKQFKADIIFADVLLQKRSGYEVCAELKADSELKTTPVVLMWSGFMELDQDKFQAAQANARLEKPFDVNALRTIIQKLVPKTKNQNLSRFLTFPKMPTINDSSMEAMSFGGVNPDSKGTATGSHDMEMIQESSPSFNMNPALSPDNDWNMESFEPIDQFSTEDFKQVDLPPVQPALTLTEEAPSLPQEEPGDAKWVQESLSKFRLNLPASEGADEEIAVDQFLTDDEPVQKTQVDLELDLADDLELEDPKAGAAAPATPAASLSAPIGLSPEQLEKIVREQCKELIENIAWKVVPELTSQIVKRELDRLLKEREKLV